MRAQKTRANRATLWLLVVATLAACHLQAADTNTARRASAMASRLPAHAVASTNEDDVGYVNFSFDQADVYSFVKLVGEITGRKFVLGEGVSGKITVVSPRVKQSEVYPLFVSILESVGCSVVEDGPLYRVVLLPERPGPMGTVVGAGEEGQGLITKVIRLKHVNAADMARVLQNKVMGGQAGGNIAAVEDTNHLIVSETASVVRRIEQIVGEIDQPGLQRVTEVVSLQHAGAEEVAEQLNAALADRQTRGQRMQQRLPSVAGVTTASDSRAALVVAAKHANALLLVGTQEQVDELKGLILKIDVETPSGQGRLNAIFLEYISAKDAATSISALLEKRNNKGQQTPALNAIAIEASEANNALLVDATPGDFDVVRKLVDQLDRAPSQVHISVMIAELTLSNDFSLGVELGAVNLPDGKGDTTVQGASTLSDSANSVLNTIQQGVFPQGITVGLAYGSRIDDNGNLTTSYPGLLNINAIKKDGRFKVLSETSLEAIDNQEAFVNIVNDIPILRSTIEGGSGTARDVIQNIERIEAGIKLKLTPHVVEGYKVRMELHPSIEVVQDSGLTPTIARREVSTTVTVPSGRTIVIAGLTRQDQITTKRKVPILGSIPLIGFLFRSEVDSDQRTNLLIFVTPVLMDSMEDHEGLRREWELKTGLPEGD